MSAKSKKRRTVKIEATWQVPLDLGAVTSAVPVATAPKPGAVVFTDPDPIRIMVSTSPLELFLRAAGFASVIALRTFLRALDWQPFIDKYKAGGRPPYHPAAMVGIVMLGVMEGRTSLRELET